ncbi:hypothetical protein U9M48_042622 [Paspalum notatum var. saurae]|uniref:CCHC-type domain-containing protein n=1 Tax=Paspalum notatum var. saurae TaxID=547442 RepID=A0AAQ3UXH7_PASNO
MLTVSSDEDHHKKHSHKSTSRKSSSTSYKCLMAQGKNESDVCNGGDLSHNELEQQEARLICKNKSLKAQLASSSTNYEELVLKFDMVLDHNDELTKKVEALELKATSSDASTLSFEKSKKDASTSCFDLNAKPHSPFCKLFISWYEETCMEEEIEVLKQEVNRLKKDVARQQGQRKQAQPSQDNLLKVVKKLEESQTVVCFFCNKEGHKSYMCRLKRKEEANKRERKQKKSVTPKAP